MTRLADLREPRKTIGGVNLVVGLRPELWRDRVGAAAPADLHGFDEPVTGPDGFEMPATQHDALLWLAGAAYDVVFDEARKAIAALAPVARVVTETSSWPYRHDRDLTGFVDGTENPSLAHAPDVALVPPGVPGAGGSVLLQRWVHDVGAWEGLTAGTTSFRLSPPCEHSRARPGTDGGRPSPFSDGPAGDPDEVGGRVPVKSR